MAARGERQGAVLGKDVAALTDGAHHVIDLAAFLGREVLNLVAGSVEGGADEVGHTGVDDDKLLDGALLDVEHSADERATLAHDGSAQLEVELLTGTQLQIALEGGEVGFQIGQGMSVGVFVVDAQTSAYVDVGEDDAVAFEHLLQLVDAQAEGGEILHVEYLAADVEVESNALDVGHRLTALYGADHVLHSNAELVLGPSGGGVFVGVGAYVGVDAEGYAGHLAVLLGQLVDDLELGYALHVEAEDVGLEGEFYLPVALADTGEGNLAGGETCAEADFDFPSADAVGSQPGFLDVAKDFGMGAGLDGVVDMIVGEQLLANGVEGLVEQRRVVVVEGGAQMLEFVDGELHIGGKSV